MNYPPEHRPSLSFSLARCCNYFLEFIMALLGSVMLCMLLFCWLEGNLNYFGGAPRPQHEAPKLKEDIVAE